MKEPIQTLESKHLCCSYRLLAPGGILYAKAVLTTARYFSRQTVTGYVISFRYILYSVPPRRHAPLLHYALRSLANETSTPAETNTRRSAP